MDSMCSVMDPMCSVMDPASAHTLICFYFFTCVVEQDDLFAGLTLGMEAFTHLLWYVLDI